MSCPRPFSIRRYFRAWQGGISVHASRTEIRSNPAVFLKAFFEWNRTIVEIGFLQAIPYNKLAAREKEKTTLLGTF